MEIVNIVNLNNMNFLLMKMDDVSLVNCLSDCSGYGFCVKGLCVCEVNSDLWLFVC